MESSRKQEDNIKTVYFHIHGTRDMGPYLVPRFFQWASRKAHPDLFTDSDRLSLLHLDGKDTPSGCQNFKDIYERYTNPEDRYYFQWPGKLSEESRKESGKFLADAIREMQGDQKLRVIIVGHSHGGTVGFEAAKELEDNKDIEFHMVTVETPLSIDPVILPGDNVASWQHFYTPKDIMQAGGSALMQDVSLAYTRKVEDVHLSHVRSELASGKSLFETKELPETYRSTELTKATFKAPHENSMKPPLSDDVCKASIELLDKGMGKTAELPPRARI